VNKSSPFKLPQLEQPPSADLSAETLVGLSVDTPSIGAIAARLVAVEGFLSLLVRDLGYDDFIREILSVTLKAIPSEAGSVLEVDSRTQALFFRAMSGHASEKLSNILIPWGKGLVGYVAESRTPVLVQDVATDPRHLTAVSMAVGFENRNLIAVPIIIRSQVFCVIELFNRVGKSTFDQEDLQLLLKLAESAGHAIEVRLMLNQQRRAA